MVLCLFLLLAVLAGCGSTGSGTTSSGTALAEQTGKKPLVIYFTYSENIGNTSDMSVDAVTSASLHEPTENKEGNMQVMVKEIQEKTGADAFSILVQDPTIRHSGCHTASNPLHEFLRRLCHRPATIHPICNIFHFR